MPAFTLNNVNRTLAQLGHETSEHILIHFLPLAPALLGGVGIQTPNLALVDAQTEDLVGAIIQRKVKFIEQHIIGQSLRRRYQLGISLGGQLLSQFFDTAQGILSLTQQSRDAGSGTLDGRRRHLDVLLGIDQILPLDIVRADLALELVPSAGGQDDPAALILIPLEQTAHSGGDAGSLLGGQGVGRKDAGRGGDARDATKGAGHTGKGFSARDTGVAGIGGGALFDRVGAGILDAGESNEQSDAGLVHNYNILFWLAFMEKQCMEYRI